METIHDLKTVIDRVSAVRDLYVRYSRGPEYDLRSTSRDYEADVPLPGLPATNLFPEPWWTRSTADWVARRVCKYLDLVQQDGDRRAWVLTGEVVGAGPDHEPLLGSVRPVAWLDSAVLDQAREHYHQHFDVGRSSDEGS